VILAAVYLLLLFSPPFFILNFSLSFADKNEDSCLSVNSIYIYWIGLDDVDNNVTIYICMERKGLNQHSTSGLFYVHSFDKNYGSKQVHCLNDFLTCENH
jgi:hypothetical protein